MLSVREKEQIAKEKELKSWEADLRSREFALIEESKSIYESSETLMKQRNKIYDQKEKMLFRSSENTRQVWMNEMQAQQLEEKKQLVNMLQKENNGLKNEIIAMLRRIDLKTEKNIFIDYILPFIPALTIIIGFVILNKKIEKIELPNEVYSEIFKIFNKLNPEDKEKLKKIILDFGANQNGQSA